MKKLIIIIVTLLAALWAGSAAEAAIIVGRISHAEGDIYRYMDVDDSWVATQRQSPAGIEDVLATGPESRVEITFPNDLLLRLDENTEIEILELDDDLGVFVLSSGLARFYNRSGSGKLVIETVRGTATVASGSVVDMRADGSSIIVSAVAGEATFQSIQNGVESLEVISGSTSLEFREKSIVAGTGPINWNWGNWCAVREGAWAQNRLVRSEYLPESMQEYAYEIEPYGSWSRVYYRGYYYWAWKPHYVAVGWSPYTTGYWYDWRGSPVWMDHNPWGWVTHHHGNWISMNGSWMWTPYVHVSHVPGVTLVGFNITFNRTYRSHWHPGRVRWISHNDYIGWFPLAPWETYYGHRRWGPGTVLVQGGPAFSLSINLSQHKHIDHAVIISNRHLHKRGPVVINNYNTVKITNINKRTIVKDYKPLLTAERERTGRHKAAKTGPDANSARRSAWAQRERKKTRAGETARQKRPEKRDERVIQTGRDVQKERTAQRSLQRDSGPKVANKQTKVIARNRQYSAESAGQKKVTRFEQRVPGPKIAKQEKPAQRKGLVARISPERTVEKKVARLEQRVSGPKVSKQEKPVQRKGIAARISPESAVEKRVTRLKQRVPGPKVAKQEKSAQRKSIAANIPLQTTSVARVDREQKRTNEASQATIKNSSRTIVVQKKTTAATRSDTKKREQVQKKETSRSQRQVARNKEGSKRADLKNDRKSSVPREREKKKIAQKNVRNQNNAPERNENRQMGGRDWFSASMNNRRMQ